MALEFTQRFRRQVSPYNVVQSLSVLAGSNYCPALQTIKADGTPSVDRASCPTVLQAVITATSADDYGTIASVTDSAITNIKWMVQRSDENTGTDISLHSDWTGKFTIGTGADKGKLFVKMNIPANARWKIWMECDISDQRRGYVVAIPIVTDSVLLYSISDASEKYTMSIDRPNGELYEPAIDQRLIHEYLTGKGIAHTLTDDGNTYLRDIHVQLYQGATPLPATDYTIKVYSVDSVGYRTEVTPATDDCYYAINGNTVTFDLRHATSKSYQLACEVDGNEVLRKTYGWAWSGEMPTTDEGIVGASTYANGDQQTYKPKFNFGKGMLQYPEVAFDMKWHQRNPGQTAKTYKGRGEQQTYDIASSSTLFLNGETEVILEIEKRGAYQHLTDENGNRLVDENGDYLIAN